MKRRMIEAERLFNRPWLISHTALKALVASHKALAPFGDDQDDEEERDYATTPDGIRCIPIKGVLTKDPYWGTTSYGEIAQTCRTAMADDSVKAVLLAVDSPGGEVSDMFDLSDALYSARSQKPLAAIANDQCYSAAYCLASASERLFVTRTAGTGSIGCFTAHVDYSKMLHDSGIAVTYVHSGARKVDGNPTEPLSDQAREDLQDECDRIRAMFVATVARNRGVSADDLMDTEAATYMSEDGIPLLCDQVGTINDAVAYLRSRIGIEGSRGLSRSRRSQHRGFALLADKPAEPVLSPLYAAAFGEGRPGWADREFPPAGGLARAATLAVRSFPVMRAAVSDRGSDRKISMLAVPYDSYANLGPFLETYQRGCFHDGLDDDPRALAHHDEACILGRASAGTAVFFEDSAGVHCEIPEAPKTSWADDLLVSMRRGDVRQASAAFWILKDRWIQRGADRVRIIEKARLREASVHGFPAYEATVAAAAPALAAAAHGETDLDRARRRLAALSPQTDLEKCRTRLANLAQRNQ